jgi:hypothetical protein
MIVSPLTNSRENVTFTKKQRLLRTNEPLFQLQFPKEVKNRIGTVKSDRALLYMPVFQAAH